MTNLTRVLSEFSLDSSRASITAVSEGLINHTWRVSCDGGTFILQEINTEVFRSPFAIAENIDRVTAFLRIRHPHYLFPSPISSRHGSRLVQIDGQYFRMFPFIEGSLTINKVTHPVEAYEAARQFGTFTALLADFPVDDLRITIPEFHNLSLRYQQYEDALRHGNAERADRAKDVIGELKEQEQIILTYRDIESSKTFQRRVIHHDTKISNVLFGGSGTALCVIDLDTVMPGYFISDLGDMMRTYVSQANEEEQDVTKISIRMPVVEAILNGYLSQMRKFLTREEQQSIGYAGLFMTYMQALRFFTDHLNNDMYYGASYEGHNLSRTTNQLQLLRLMKKHDPEIRDLIRTILS